MLWDERIGGDRTYGKGLFKVDFKEIEMNTEPGKHFVTLSLYYPPGDEVSLLKDGYHELINRSVFPI